jgi:hypothetical protein
MITGHRFMIPIHQCALSIDNQRTTELHGTALQGSRQMAGKQGRKTVFDGLDIKKFSQPLAKGEHLVGLPMRVGKKATGIAGSPAKRTEIFDLTMPDYHKVGAGSGKILLTGSQFSNLLTA